MDAQDRWEWGKSMEQYMNVLPSVDCYFLQTIKLKEGSSKRTWVEGNRRFVWMKIPQFYIHTFSENVNAFVILIAQ